MTVDILRLSILNCVAVIICAFGVELHAQSPENVKNWDFRATIVGGKLEVYVYSWHTTAATPRTAYQTLHYSMNNLPKSKAITIDPADKFVPANSRRTPATTTTLTPFEDYTEPWVKVQSGNAGSVSDIIELDLTPVPFGQLAIVDLDGFSWSGMQNGVPTNFFVRRPRLYWKNPDINGLNGAGWQNAQTLKISLLHKGGGPNIMLPDEPISAPQSGMKKLFFYYEAPMWDGDPYVHGDGKWHIFVRPIHNGTGTNPKDPLGTIIFPDMDLSLSP